LYTGTPCQIAGLKKFLGNEYTKLLTVDVICHGVPSPGIWEKYITRLMKKISAGDIRDIRFRRKEKRSDLYNNFYYYYFYFFFLRDKQWYSYGESRKDNLFYSYFSRHLFRSSCYNCPYRDIYTPAADITIGDAVTTKQINEQIEMPSTIIVRTIRGKDVLEKLKDHFDIFEPLPLEAVNAYYEHEKLSIELDKKIKRRKLSNHIAMLIPLEYFKWIWNHDKFHVVIKRKIKKLCRKNTI
jgi:coenzyme F420-reducing hydrogenase beta subunit